MNASYLRFQDADLISQLAFQDRRNRKAGNRVRVRVGVSAGVVRQRERRGRILWSVCWQHFGLVRFDRLIQRIVLKKFHQILNNKFHWFFTLLLYYIAYAYYAIHCASIQMLSYMLNFIIQYTKIVSIILVIFTKIPRRMISWDHRVAHLLLLSPCPSQ